MPLLAYAGIGIAASEQPLNISFPSLKQAAAMGLTGAIERCIHLFQFSFPCKANWFISVSVPSLVSLPGEFSLEADLSPGLDLNLNFSALTSATSINVFGDVARYMPPILILLYS